MRCSRLPARANIWDRIVHYRDSLLQALRLMAVFHPSVEFASALGTIVLIGSLIAALPLAAICARPIAPVFVIHEAKKRKDYVGSVCTIMTGEVSVKFGQARIEEGGYVLDVPVRCDTDHVFSRHDQPCWSQCAAIPMRIS